MDKQITTEDRAFADFEAELIQGLREKRPLAGPRDCSRT